MLGHINIFRYLVQQGWCLLVAVWTISNLENFFTELSNQMQILYETTASNIILRTGQWVFE